MYFNNIQELWAMAGHGPFVWAAYGITFATLLALLWVPLRTRQQQSRNLRAYYRRLNASATSLTDGEN